jgi:hypothetical protein
MCDQESTMKAWRETEKTQTLKPAAQKQNRFPPTRTLTKSVKTKLTNVGQNQAEPQLRTNDD